MDSVIIYFLSVSDEVKAFDVEFSVQDHIEIVTEIDFIVGRLLWQHYRSIILLDNCLFRLNIADLK